MGGLGHLKLKCAHLVNLVKMQILIQQVWAEGLGLGMSNQQPRDGSAAGLGTHLDKHESR